jgi:hypothetical protein
MTHAFAAPGVVAAVAAVVTTTMVVVHDARVGGFGAEPAAPPR